MDFRLLGPLEVLESDRPISLGRGRQRALFALLLIHANEVVSTDRLIDELWGEAPPRTALKSVQVYVSRLRKELGDGRLLTRAPGYVLRVEPSEVDVARFERLVADADAADPQTAADKLRGALELWRGPALGDMAFEPFAQAEIARLGEARAAATEKRIDADLACGRHAELIGELESLVAQHPLRERLRSQLMVALYRSGRQADALSAYRKARRELSEGLGLEPGEELRALEQAILRHDPSLDLPGGVAPWTSRDARERPASETPEHPATLARRSRVTPRRLLVAAGAVILAAAAAAGVVELTEDGGSGEALAEVAPDSLAILDPETNSIVGQISIPGQPSLVAAEGRSIWVASDTSRTISRIDGRTLAIREVVPTNALPYDLAASGQSVWVLDRERPALVRLDATYRSVADRRRFPGARALTAAFGAGLDAGRGAVWVADGTSKLLRLGRDGRGASRRFDVGRPLDDVTIGRRTIWAISARSASALEIDPSSGRVLTRIPITSRPGSTRPVPIAVTADTRAVWVLNANTPSVTRIDPDLQTVRATIPLGVGSNPTSIATGAGAVWVAVSGEGAVVRIDPRTGEVRSIPVGGAPTGVAVSLGKIWVSVQPGFRSPLASRARTTRVAGALTEPYCSGVEFGGAGRPRLLIVSDFPLQHGGGPFSSLQYSDAVRFVLARRGFKAGSHTVGYQSCDDSSVRQTPYSYTEATCRRNAHAYVRAPAVVGIVGPFDSPCAAVQIPVLNRAEGGPLAAISGSTTQLGLTHKGPGAGPGEPERYYPTGVRSFARVVAADDVQGAADAMMAKRIGAQRLFVLDDDEPYGSAIAVMVRRAARGLGLEIAGAGRWDYRDRRFTELARRIKRSAADGVFLGGIITANGPRLLRDLRAVLGPDVPVIAPDGFSDFEALTEGAGPAAEGVVVSVPGVPAERLRGSGRRFVEDFEEAIGAEATPYSITAAQATEVLLDAIAASDGTRASVTRNVFRARVTNGILGDFEIDQNGDTTAGGVTMYRIENGMPRVADVITPPPSLVR
jgi:DNA-binding SARP family transcriptional activator/ABC-type branched-subunit amino acid transport system substrate-binding protein/DNA-binding beta-propeller fold protein YncE